MRDHANCYQVLTVDKTEAQGKLGYEKADAKKQGKKRETD